MARGGFVGVVGGFGEEGEEFGGDVVEGVVGGVGRCMTIRGARPAFRGGKEVHDALAPDEDAEQFAGALVHDFDAAPFRRAEVEQGVAQGEVEDVAAGLFDLVADGRRFGHFYNLVQESTRIRQSGSLPGGLVVGESSRTDQLRGTVER